MGGSHNKRFDRVHENMNAHEDTALRKQSVHLLFPGASAAPKDTWNAFGRNHRLLKLRFLTYEVSALKNLKPLELALPLSWGTCSKGLIAQRGGGWDHFRCVLIICSLSKIVNHGIYFL